MTATDSPSSAQPPKRNDLMSRIAYFCQTLWLFNLSDLKTIVMPNTTFGIINALVAHKYGITTVGSDPISENAVNKPWRPLPQGRISPSESKRLMYWVYVITPFMSTAFGGGIRQNFGLIFLGTWYNEFGGSDCHPLASGAMEVALGFQLPVLFAGTPGSDVAMPLFHWLGIIVAAIVTTMHTRHV
ncbi:hypothetical protein F5883DRAFT_696909 [Diaporthe sp. PMI_573]|nr:hypothetical protein F5883DRAFT_696909 [Diaporthaceae sp. PMI_573]